MGSTVDVQKQLQLQNLRYTRLDHSKSVFEQLDLFATNIQLLKQYYKLASKLGDLGVFEESRNIILQIESDFKLYKPEVK